MAVTEETPIASSVANGVTTVFPHTFTLLDDADLVVTGTTGGVTSTYVFGVDYTVSGVGTSSGSVTFGAAPASGVIVTRYRDIGLERTTDYQDNGDLLADAVNVDFDRLWFALQDIFNGGKVVPTCVRAPNGETLIALPAAASRAGYFLGFDGSGQPTLLSATSGTAAALSADLATSSDALKGDALIGVKLNATGSTARTQHAKNAETLVSVMDFGATGDGSTDDTAAIQAAITYVENTYDPAVYASNSPAAGSCRLFFPAGYYKVTDVLNITKKIAIEGEGLSEFSSGARIVQTVTNKDLFKVTPIAQGCSVSFENMTLMSNIGGTGHLIHVVRGGSGSTCNSQRYINCTFGTPQSQSICIEAGDDIVIQSPLFDVSSGGAIYLGTGTAADVCSNVRIIAPNFFDIPTRCILLQNVINLSIVAPQVYRVGSGRTQFFVDGYTLTPYQLKNISITGGSFGGTSSGVDCLVKATAVDGLAVVGTTGRLLGAGSGATLSCVELSGTCLNVQIGSNNWSGSFDTVHFYYDSGGGGSVTATSIVGNTFNNTSGAGVCINASSTTGIFWPNKFTGFTRDVTTGDYLASGLPLNQQVTLTYGATVSTDASLGSSFAITATNGTAFTISNPTSPSTGQVIRYTIRNASGGALGVITWGAAFKMVVFANPANGFSRTIEFRYDSTNWVEMVRGAADIPN